MSNRCSFRYLASKLPSVQQANTTSKRSKQRELICLRSHIVQAACVSRHHAFLPKVHRSMRGSSVTINRLHW